MSQRTSINADGKIYVNYSTKKEFFYSTKKNSMLENVFALLNLVK